MIKSSLKIGALLRAYARSADSVSAVVAGVTTAIDSLVSAGIDDVQVVVWAESNNPIADCGQTFEALEKGFIGRSGVHLMQVIEGDVFVDALNQGIAEQRRRGITHSLILSWEAASVINRNLIDDLYKAVEEGALVVGVALPQLAQFVERGAVMNTCALWSLDALQTIGGFDARDIKPREVNHYDGSNAGIGEFLPMLKMVKHFGKPVLAIIRPTGRSAIAVPPERQELQRKKIESKSQRIAGMLAQTGFTWSDLEAAILPGYPR